MKKYIYLVSIYLVSTIILGLLLSAVFNSELIGPSTRIELFILFGPAMALLLYSMLEVYVVSSFTIVTLSALFLKTSKKIFIFLSAITWLLAGFLSVGFMAGV